MRRSVGCCVRSVRFELTLNRVWAGFLCIGIRALGGSPRNRTLHAFANGLQPFWIPRSRDCHMRDDHTRVIFTCQSPIGRRTQQQSRATTVEVRRIELRSATHPPWGFDVTSNPSTPVRMTGAPKPKALYASYSAVGTGVDPVTSRLTTEGSTVELTDQLWSICRCAGHNALVDLLGIEPSLEPRKGSAAPTRRPSMSRLSHHLVICQAERKGGGSNSYAVSRRQFSRLLPPPSIGWPFHVFSLARKREDSNLRQCYLLSISSRARSSTLARFQGRCGETRTRDCLFVGQEPLPLDDTPLDVGAGFEPIGFQAFRP
jgi:hypothetical protein